MRRFVRRPAVRNGINLRRLSPFHREENQFEGMDFDVGLIIYLFIYCFFRPGERYGSKETPLPTPSYKSNAWAKNRHRSSETPRLSRGMTGRGSFDFKSNVQGSAHVGRHGSAPTLTRLSPTHTLLKRYAVCLLPMPFAFSYSMPFAFSPCLLPSPHAFCLLLFPLPSPMPFAFSLCLFPMPLPSPYAFCLLPIPFAFSLCLLPSPMPFAFSYAFCLLPMPFAFSPCLLPSPMPLPSPYAFAFFPFKRSRQFLKWF